MKNKFRSFGKLSIVFSIVALLALTGFAITACADDEVVPLEGFAADLVADMKVGWNLGNTLDANGSGSTVEQWETLWVKTKTTQEHFTTLKNAGFNAVRIPVSWAKTAGGAPNYTINTDWMNRVKEIVGYALDEGMYVILNTHHDESIFTFENSNAAAGQAAFKKIWEQIANAFKNSDDKKLIFEGLNEPRTKGSANEWMGGTKAERDNLNAYYQIFVDTVRKSGGKNATRALLINPYAASAEEAALSDLRIPKDTIENRIIVSIHSYSPYNFALNTDKTFNTWSKNNSDDKSAITTGIDRAYNTFVRKGIPVLIGEFGAMNKNNVDARAEWAEYYTGYARSKGMPCFWWDNAATTGTKDDDELFGLLNRTNNTFTYPKVVDGLMKGSGGK